MISMIAGNDTTAAAIRMTMLSLMTNPRVYSKFKSVVQAAIHEGKASNPIKLEEAKKIPYIQVCNPPQDSPVLDIILIHI